MKWYKHDPDAFLIGTAVLSMEECGAYIRVLDLIYSHDGDLPDDDQLIARAIHCNPRTWRALKAALIARGKIWIEGSKISGKRVEYTLNESRKFAELQANRAKRRWKSTAGECQGGNAKTTTTTTTKDSDTYVSGAEAPPDPSIAERELFERGRQIIGKKAGGLIAKLLRSRGGNVALARSALELAATKANPTSYVIAAISRGPPAAPNVVTLKDRKKQEWQDAYDHLKRAAERAEAGDDSGAETMRLFPPITG